MSESAGIFEVDDVVWLETETHDALTYNVRTPDLSLADPTTLVLNIRRSTDAIYEQLDFSAPWTGDPDFERIDTGKFRYRVELDTEGELEWWFTAEGAVLGSSATKHIYVRPR